MVTAPVGKPKRLKGCQDSPWVKPKSPCHPQYTLTEFLATVLNVTLRHDSGNRSKICFGILTSQVANPNEIFAIENVNSYSFRQVISSQFRYCVINRNHGYDTGLQFWAWVTPYKPQAWACILVAQFVSLITITLQDGPDKNIISHLFYNLLTVLAIHVRQNTGSQTVLKWILHLVMILILGVYETYFTSQVIVPPVRDNTLSFVTLLKTGYKVGHSANSEGFLLRYELDFKRLGISEWIKEEKHSVRLENREEFSKLKHNETLKLMVSDVVIAADRKLESATEEYRNVVRNSCRLASDKFSSTETYDYVHVIMRREAFAALRVTAEFGFFEGFWRTIHLNLKLRKMKRSTMKEQRRGKYFVDASETLKWADIIRLDDLHSLFLIFGALLSFSLLAFIAERVQYFF